MLKIVQTDTLGKTTVVSCDTPAEAAEFIQMAQSNRPVAQKATPVTQTKKTTTTTARRKKSSSWQRWTKGEVEAMLDNIDKPAKVVANHPVMRGRSVGAVYVQMDALKGGKSKVSNPIKRHLETISRERAERVSAE